jgi:hypothetical protein
MRRRTPPKVVKLLKYPPVCTPYDVGPTLKGQLPLSKPMTKFYQTLNSLHPTHRNAVKRIIQRSALCTSCSFPKSITAALLQTEHIHFHQKQALVFALLSRHYGLEPRLLAEFFVALTLLYGPGYWGDNDKNRIEVAQMAIDVLECRADSKIVVPYPDSRVMEVYDLAMYRKYGTFVVTHWASVHEVTALVKSSGHSESVVLPALTAQPSRPHVLVGCGECAADSPGEFLRVLRRVGGLPPRMQRYVDA